MLHWTYGFKKGWQVSCVTTRSGCHRQTARPNCGILSKPVGQAGQQHILIVCQVQGPSCPPSNLKWRQCKQSKSVAHSQESMAWDVGWVGTQQSYHTHCFYRGPKCTPGDILPAWKEGIVTLISFLFHTWTWFLHLRKGARILRAGSLKFLCLENKLRILSLW